MASSSLVLPGALYVGEDDRARIVAHTGPAAGWFVPRGIQDWSFEVAVVVRGALTEDIRRATKLVMPEEQLPPAKNPLTLQAALKSPLVAVSSKLTSKLVELGARVHTVGVDRVSSSFYYLAEGGGEAPITVSGDLVAAVAAMLGERADNAAIERVLDGLADRLLRSLSRDRVTELGMELANALPRASSDGTGGQGIDLDGFERELASLVAASEKYSAFAQDIVSKLTDTYERKLEVPLFGEARKTSQGPFELEVGDQKVALVTHERWVMSGPLTEPKPAPKPAPTPAPEPKVEAKAPASEPKVEAKTPAPEPKPEPKVEAKTPASEPKPEPKVEAKAPAPEPKPAPAPEPKVEAKTTAAAPKPVPAPEPKVEARTPEPKPEPKAEPAPLQPTPIISIGQSDKAEPPKAEPPKAEPPKAEPPKAEPPKAEPTPARAPEAKAERKAEASGKDANAGALDKTREKAKTIQPAESSASSSLVPLLLLALVAAGLWYFFLRP